MTNLFTGIVEGTGTVRAVERSGRTLRLAISAGRLAAGLSAGDSVAVNGVCLTVTKVNGGEFWADVMPETFDRTALARLRPGEPVNLERPLSPSGRLGGHLVQGHVDGVGTVAAVREEENARILTIRAPAGVLRYLVPKGSVAVDGVSLTVVDVAPDHFTVSLIPHTATVTTLGRRRPGDPVNIEADVIAKYVERFVALHLGAPMSRPALPGAAGPAD